MPTRKICQGIIFYNPDVTTTAIVVKILLEFSEIWPGPLVEPFTIVTNALHIAVVRVPQFTESSQRRAKRYTHDTKWHGRMRLTLEGRKPSTSRGLRMTRALIIERLADEFDEAKAQRIATSKAGREELANYFDGKSIGLALALTLVRRLPTW